MVLTDQEWTQFEECGSFHVTGTDGKTYEIIYDEYNGTNGNVYEISEDGERVARLCAHPDKYVRGVGNRRAELPLLDAVAAQAITLKFNTGHFHEMANVHWRRTPEEAQAHREHRERVLAASEATADRLTEQLADRDRAAAAAHLRDVGMHRTADQVERGQIPGRLRLNSPLAS